MATIVCTLWFAAKARFIVVTVQDFLVMTGHYSLGVEGIYNLFLKKTWWWTSILWSIDSCQKRLSADLCHITVLRAQVYEWLRTGDVFWKLSADQLLVFNWSQTQVHNLSLRHCLVVSIASPGSFRFHEYDREWPLTRGCWKFQVNVWVKSKLQHPPPGHSPGIWHLCCPREEGIWLSGSSRGWGIWSLCEGGGEFEP